MLRKLEEGRRRRGGDAVTVRGTDRARGNGVQSVVRISGRVVSPKRSRIFPRWRNTTPARATISAISKRPRQAVSIPIIGSLNGASLRRLGALCQDDRGRWRRRAGIEHLLRADRPQHDGCRCRAALCRSWWRKCVSQFPYLLAVKIGPNFTSLPNFAQQTGRGRCRRSGAVQSLCRSRH